MTPPRQSATTLTRAEIDDHLDGVFAEIVRETFASDERVNARGWGTMPTTVVQYLRREDLPSSVWVVPIGLAQLGAPLEAVRFLYRTLVSDETSARALQATFVKPEAEGYLGCAIACEGYAYPGTREEGERRHPGRPLAAVPEAQDTRTISGLTVDHRRFTVFRMREHDAVAAKVDFDVGQDPTLPDPAFETLLADINVAFQDLYARRLNGS